MFGKNKNEPTADLEIFTIFDSKTQSYGNPTFAVNQHDLVRQIINMFQDPTQKTNQLLTNAEDFSIFRIGSYWKRTGELQSCTLTHVANLHDLRAIAQPATLQAVPSN